MAGLDKLGLGTVRTPGELDAFIRSRFKYMTEPYEIIMSPEVALCHIFEQGFFVGDCDDVAVFTAAILAVLHVPAQFVAIRTLAGVADYLHVFVQGFIDGVWTTFDATVKPGTVYRQFGQMVIHV